MNKKDLALVLSLMEELKDEKPKRTKVVRGKVGPKGEKGEKGDKGDSFHFEQHQDYFLSQLKSLYEDNKNELKLKFNDLSKLEKLSLKGDKGEKGEKGDKGHDGSSVTIDEVRKDIFKYIDNIKEDLKLKFDDISEEDRLTLRGPRGQKGKAGKSFNFEKEQDKILKALDRVFQDNVDRLKLSFKDLSEEEKNQLKLKFSDLSYEDKEELRGPQGKRGPKGRDFSYTDNQENILNDLGQIFQKEKPNLKLKFSDLNEDEIKELKGPRGPRGQKGKSVKLEDVEEKVLDHIIKNHNLFKLNFRDLTAYEKDQLKGKKGDRGYPGLDGIDGIDGKDAPRVRSVKIKKRRENIYYFEFTFTDLTIERTNDFRIPFDQYVQNVISSSVVDTNLVNVPCAEDVYRGAAVYMDSNKVAQLAIANSWNTSNVIGVVDSVPSNGFCFVRVSGRMGSRAFESLPEEELYLSFSEAGKLTNIAPFTKGQVRVRVGKAITDEYLVVNVGERTRIEA